MKAIEAVILVILGVISFLVALAINLILPAIGVALIVWLVIVVLKHSGVLHG